MWGSSSLGVSGAEPGGQGRAGEFASIGKEESEQRERRACAHTHHCHRCCSHHTSGTADVRVLRRHLRLPGPLSARPSLLFRRPPWWCAIGRRVVKAFVVVVERDGAHDILY